jgi:PII-like signaling protein
VTQSSASPGPAPQPEEAYLLRIYVLEDQRYEFMPLADWICQKASEQGLAGPTVLPGLEGFATHGSPSPPGIMTRSGQRPLVIELIDSRERLAQFFQTVAAALDGGITTLQPVIVFKPPRR